MQLKIVEVGDEVVFLVEDHILRIRKALGLHVDRGIVVFVGEKTIDGVRQILVRFRDQRRAEPCYENWFKIIKKEPEADVEV